jgi:hypothetical protein
MSKTKNFPARPATLGNKIRKQNPWGLGEKLASLIEDNWEDVKANYPNLEKLPPFVAFGENHRLSLKWVVTGVINDRL